MAIFKTLFELRLKAHNRPVEDYLTEILKFVLSRDIDLLNHFLNYFSIIDNKIDEFEITSQLSLKKINNHSTDSRPDMAIFLEEKSIFFENKVNSKEGYKQLKRYAEQLEEIADGKKTLVYITKHYDFKNPEEIFGDCIKEIEFISLRWYMVYRFLKLYKADPIIFELLIFMKQNDLSMNNQFNPSDIITLTNFTNVRRMMDESMFGEVSKKFELINHGISQKSTMMTQLRDNDRYVYYQYHNNRMKCMLGYWMNSRNEKDYPDIGIIIEIAPQSTDRKNVISTFKKISEKYDSWQTVSIINPKDWAKLSYRTSLQTFLSEESQIEEIKKFFINGLNEWKQIINEYPDLPTN